jgi:hypothetical protein
MGTIATSGHRRHRVPAIGSLHPAVVVLYIQFESTQIRGYNEKRVNRHEITRYYQGSLVANVPLSLDCRREECSVIHLTHQIAVGRKWYVTLLLPKVH